MGSDTFQLNLLKYIDLLPKESLKFLILDATPKPDERWESPWSNNTKIRFTSFEELRGYVNQCFKDDLRIMSLHAVYTDNTFIYLDVLIPKVKVFNTAEKMTSQKLAEAGLLGQDGFIQYYELVF